MVRVKVCGITNMDDAMVAVEAGADALGFIFVQNSPRYIPPGDAGSIIRELPPFVSTVGVFVNAVRGFVEGAVGLSGVRLLQFHGEEEPGHCGSYGLPYVKAFRVKDEGSLALIDGYLNASAMLLDTYDEKEHGGTGRTFNWELAAKAAEEYRVILAGGLNPDNVADAVRMVRPYAVDVSSGVESTKGKKDHDAVRRFISAAKCVLD
jgi:phosphoribosylanthranilate isomerase